MIGIIDYDAGNIRSVEKAMKYLGQDVCITRDRDTLLRADKVILPGVGSFGDAMNHLQESPGVEGLGILKGEILKIPETEGLKIPHMGWNSLTLHNQGRLFKGLEEHPYVYFVHSYYLKAEEESIVKATTQYGVTIHASVEKGNVFACQFHPEKSSRAGLQMLKNFAEL